MNEIDIKLRGDNAWPEIRNKPTHRIRNDVLHIARLEGGCPSGKSSVAFRVDLPDGSVVVAETTMALFLGTTAALLAAEEMAGQETPYRIIFPGRTGS